jgi:hypothetical protein
MHNAAHEIRLGLIKARISCKQTRSGLRHSISVVRLYRNGDVWKQSTRFGRDDLPLVRLVLDLAHTWVLQHGQTPRASRAIDERS